MKRGRHPGSMILLAAVAFSLPAAAGTVQHRFTVRLDPGNGRIAVTDALELPADWIGRGGAVEFALHSALEVRDSTVPFESVGDPEPARGLTLNGREVERDSEATVRRYTVAEIPTDGRIRLSYDGRMDFGLSAPDEEYTRGFRDTVGVLSADGVYLSGAGFWVPTFDDGLVLYELEVEQPADWHVISAGAGTSRGTDGHARWTSATPTDEVYLTGGPLRVWRDRAGSVETLVYLHEADDGLASKYLEATARYLAMYRELIGEYPYSKFALVENFWETGFGMPSFTLLGPQVIRFPFILTSSYPHEILHNWWGNGVFVDYASGNWCEGLTAYLADHLIQEQQGRGEAYRRDTLQKYRNYVRESRDFPLVEFRSRHSASTEAVGYGKSLMGFHMLRRKLGDDAFRASLSGFYGAFRGRQASFRDLERSFESATGVELGPFFDAWIERSGAPALEVRDVVVEVAGSARIVRGVLRQVQQGPAFPLDVPLVLDAEGGQRQIQVVPMADSSAEFAIRIDAPPVLLRVDPQYDLFRLLDPREMPPSIGQIFGDPAIVAFLPSSEGAAAEARYRDLVEGWVSDSHAIEVRSDADPAPLPTDRSIWLLGRKNVLAARLFAPGEVPGLDVAGKGVELAGEPMSLEGHSLVAVRRHPDDDEHAVGWLVVDPPAASPGLARKLPHYGKYSYLGFEGEAPDNVIKGQWPATDSPLTVDLRPGDSPGAPQIAPFEAREALAELPPVFSEQRLAEHVRLLASPELEGRGIGTRGLDRAAQYVADRFAAIGLVPAGDDGGYLQGFTVAAGPDGTPVRVANVVGYLEGARADRAGQSVIVSAHLDHLGFGWPDVHQGDEGQLHPGADDNASGVAVLIELAASFATADPPPRDLVFIAFTAEEAGRLGSRWFVDHPGRFSLDGVRGVINLDTVGRLFDGSISVLATDTADEWQHVFRGVSYVTGIPSKNITQPLDSSDQMTFIERGLPAVQVFTGAHSDYHRPTDTGERIDTAGLVKVATFVREAVAYLVDREPPLTVTIAGATASTPAARPSGGRRVSFGTVPEFEFAGPGVQVASLVPDSPAERAGIRAGDVLVRLDDHDIADLRAFSELLRACEPGQTVRATVRRDGTELTIPVTLDAR